LKQELLAKKNSTDSSKVYSRAITHHTPALAGGTSAGHNEHKRLK
jgi:hypothetical protein